MKVFLLLSLALVVVHCEDLPNVETAIVGQFMGDAYYAFANTITTQTSDKAKDDLLKLMLAQNGENIGSTLKQSSEVFAKMFNEQEDIWAWEVEGMKSKFPEQSGLIEAAAKKIHDGGKPDESGLSNDIIDTLRKAHDVLNLYAPIMKALVNIGNAFIVSSALAQDL